jgi:hypothetical protein
MLRLTLDIGTGVMESTGCLTGTLRDPIARTWGSGWSSAKQEMSGIQLPPPGETIFPCDATAMNKPARLQPHPRETYPSPPFPTVLRRTMVFRSLLPPIPDLSFPNAHHLFLNRPDQAEWEEYTLHVDALTGKTRGWLEFKDRVKRGATVFGSPSHFPHEQNEVVGILSENCIVGFSGSVFEPCTDEKASRRGYICRSMWRLFIRCWLRAFRSLYSRHHRPHTN